MMKVLTEEESIQSNIRRLQMADEWWSELPLNDKTIIMNYHRDLLIQVKCSHEFYESSLYSQKIQSCKKCGYYYTKQDDRNDKISNLLKNSNNNE